MVKIESFSEAIFGFVIKMAIKDRIRRLKNDITHGRLKQLALNYTRHKWLNLNAYDVVLLTIVISVFWVNS